MKKQKDIIGSIDDPIMQFHYSIQMRCHVYGEIVHSDYSSTGYAQVYEGWNVADQIIADYRGWGING